MPGTGGAGWGLLPAGGILEVVRGDGTYVAASPRVDPAARGELLLAAARRFAGVALSLGVRPGDTRGLLDAALADLSSQRRKRE